MEGAVLAERSLNMADKIQVSTPELQACAGEYLMSLQTLQEAVSEYRNALEALKSDWTGVAFAAMMAHVVDLTGKIVGSFERVTDAVSELGDVSDLFEENENKLKNKFSSQDVGTKSPFAG